MNKSKNIAAFCTNDHHIEKALHLRKHFKTIINIFDEEFNLIEEENQSIKKEISEIIESNDVFIFFTLLPNKWTLRLVKKIKNARKVITVFQESHQLSMHDNEVNNIVFNPDLIIAASLEEKERLQSISLDKSTEVISYGWIFNSKEPKLSTKKQDEKQNINDSLLLVLSAPNSLTFSSYESTTIRRKLIMSLVHKHPNCYLKIKPHPNERINDLLILINSLELHQRKVEIIRSNDEYLEAIENASSIYISNRTQALFDLIYTKKVHCYLLGNENFISNHVLKFSNPVNKNGIVFVEITNEECVKQFNSKYINTNVEDIRKIEALVISKTFCEIYDHESEISLWEIVLKIISLNKIETINIKRKTSKREREKHDKFHEDLIDKIFAEESLSIRTSLFIIITRIGFRSELWKKEQFIDLVRQNLNEWFIQYFIMDAIFISYQFKKKNIPLEISDRGVELLDQAIINLITKSKLFLLLIKLLDYSVAGKSGIVKNFLFSIAMRVIDTVRYLSD